MSRASGPATARGTRGTARIAKTVQTGVGPVPLRVPRDRAGTFEPVLVPKRAGRVAGGLDDMVISPLRARHVRPGHPASPGAGLRHPAVATRRSRGSPTQVLEEVRAWQSRPLDPVYAVVFLDAIMVKVRDNQVVQNKPAYLAVGIDADGEKHVLGIWLAKTAPETATAGEGARFWGSVMTDLKQPGRARHPDRLLRRAGRVRGRDHRGVRRTVVQRCVVHLIRNALRPVARRDAGEVAEGAARRSIPRRPPRPPSTPWPRSRPRRGGGSTRRPSGSSRTPGTPSPRSWPSAPPSASCSTRPTRSSR